MIFEKHSQIEKFVVSLYDQGMDRNSHSSMTISSLDMPIDVDMSKKLETTLFTPITWDFRRSVLSVVVYLTAHKSLCKTDFC